MPSGDEVVPAKSRSPAVAAALQPNVPPMMRTSTEAIPSQRMSAPTVGRYRITSSGAYTRRHAVAGDAALARDRDLEDSVSARAATARAPSRRRRVRGARPAHVPHEEPRRLDVLRRDGDGERLLRAACTRRARSTVWEALGTPAWCRSSRSLEATFHKLADGDVLFRTEDGRAVTESVAKRGRDGRAHHAARARDRDGAETIWKRSCRDVLAAAVAQEEGACMTMRAVVLDGKGGPEVLALVERPSPTPGAGATARSACAFARPPSTAPICCSAWARTPRRRILRRTSRGSSSPARSTR